MTSDILISKKEVIRRTSLSGTSIWREIKKGNFPEAKKISPNRVAWSDAEISAWVSSKIQAA